MGLGHTHLPYILRWYSRFVEKQGGSRWFVPKPNPATADFKISPLKAKIGQYPPNEAAALEMSGHLIYCEEYDHNAIATIKSNATHIQIASHFAGSGASAAR
jgi:hypothetical protein